MSLDALCSRDTATVKRYSITQGDAGGQVRTATTAARGSLSTSVTCRIQPLSVDERREFGVRAERAAWKLHTTTNPNLTVEDVVEFTDNDEVSRTADVINPSRNADGQGRLYTTILEEVGNQV